MKGVILAGGNGTRLFPNTKVTNKHLLPIYNKPMIYYPIESMLKAGITDILIMPGKDHAGDFAKLLGSGKEFNANFTFIIQDYAGGLAYPLKHIKNFVGDDNFLMILGDNVFEHDFYEDVQNFKGGAHVFCKEVGDPHRFGVAELDGNKVLKIHEKPSDPPSNWAVTGAYIYDARALDMVHQLTPSDRGELEITDLNNLYIEKGEMTATFMQGMWYDTGTHQSLAEAAYELMKKDAPGYVFTNIDQKNSPSIEAGLVLYGNEKYIESFVESAKAQSYKNIQWTVLDVQDGVDNSSSIAYLKEHLPGVQVITSEENTGYGRGHNILMRRALDSGKDFYLALNYDMIFEQNFVEELLNAAIKSPRIATVGGKMYRWDFDRRFEDNKGRTNFIDSAGITLQTSKSGVNRVVNRGEGAVDHGQFEHEQQVFGVSGVASLMRLAVLKDIAYKNEDGQLEFFDELMFMYKEDVDLAYRVQWGAYKSIYAPKAIGYHDRTANMRPKNIFEEIKVRRGRNPKINEWSWLNQRIIMMKYAQGMPVSMKIKFFIDEIKIFVYALLFERNLLLLYPRLWKLRHKIAERRVQLKQRISKREVMNILTK
jgi:glucose-1-phosphate thymidylyltransferase